MKINVVVQNSKIGKAPLKQAKKDKKIKKEELTKKKELGPSQLRQDVVTGDWVVIATGRSKRPEQYAALSMEQEDGDENQAECVFCDPQRFGQEKDLLIYNTSDGDWSLRVFPNKYPAFSKPQGGRISHQEEGPYFWMDGVGYHELIVTKDHKKNIGQLEPVLAAELLDAFQTRYLDLMNKKSVRYIEIFHNHGKKAGATISHPHSQLAAIPVISPYINLELEGAESYYRANKCCVYCTMVQWELENKTRIVYQNEDFVAFCPFASRAAFEVWILPLKHKPYFERTSDEEKLAGGLALHETLRKISKVLKHPAYNFYLHTSPCDGKDYPHYHWHIEVLPKTSVWAGFELSTGIEVSTILPEDAAGYLRAA